jgi:hypothetical protein
MVLSGVGILAAALLTTPPPKAPMAEQPALPSVSATQLLPAFKRRLEAASEEDRVRWLLAATRVHGNQFMAAQDAVDLLADGELQSLARAALAVEGYRADPRKAVQLARMLEESVLRAETLTILVGLEPRLDANQADALLVEARCLLEKKIGDGVGVSESSDSHAPRAVAPARASKTIPVQSGAKSI